MAPRIDSTASGSTYDPGSDSTDTPVDTVRLGENTLSQVAQRLGMDPDTLRQANPQISDPTRLMVGQEVRLPLCQASQGPSGNDLGGKPAPSNTASPSGLSMLDDPMSKTMAQMQLGGGGKTSAGPTSGVKYAGPPKPQKHEQWLGELAKFPGEAHQAWKKLSSADRSAVLAKMETRYGKTFAQQFKEAADKGKSQVETATYSTSPSYKLPTMTAKELEAKGYRKAGDEATGTGTYDAEVWVHPSGKTARLITSDNWPTGTGQDKPATTDAPSTSKGPEQVGPTVDPPPESPVEKAWNLLGKIQQGNDELQGLLNRNPVPWDEVHLKASHIEDAQKALDKLLYPSDANVDAPDVGDAFHQDLQKANDEFQRLYDEAQNRNPDFMQGPVVDPNPDAEDD